MNEVIVDQSGGYVRLYRKLLDNPVWTQLQPEVLKVWIGCLLRANWKPSKWYDGRSQVQIPAGAFIFSQDSLGKLCAVSRQQLRTALGHLANLNFLTIKSTSRYSLLMIENWSTYQSETIRVTSQATTDQPRPNHDLTTEEEVKKGITTPPTPSEGDDADAPLVLVSPELGENPQSTPKRKPYRDVLEQVARSVHDRHPNTQNANGRRDLSIAGVEKKLEAILKHKRILVSASEAYLGKIDRNHAAACSSEGWRKEDGQYVKSLWNYLAPTEERYDVEPAPAARKEPVRLMA